ncbi:MAG: hypothetical protein AABZ12_12925 [Planctomycetota bacterium]
MSEATEQFRQTMDPYLLGYSTPEHMQLAFLLTGGLLFPFAGGGTLLKRRPLYPDVGPWSYCGFARPSETIVEQHDGFGHAANQSYQYAVEEVLGNGYRSQASEPVRVDFDATTTRIDPPLPLFPLHVAAKPITAGKFRVTWEYDPFGQGAAPSAFQVFGGADAASVDYNTPLTDSITGLTAVVYLGPGRRHEFITAAYADGTARVFGVRARNGSGVAEKNTRTTAAKAARAVTVSLTAIEQVIPRMC